MKLSKLALSLAALAVCTTASAQVTSNRQPQTPAKAQPGVKYVPQKVAVKQQLPAQHQPQFVPQGGTSSLVGGGDDCATPDVIAGSGPHAVDNTVATTGTQGQAEAICLFFGQVGITTDVWFTWTAPSTGTFQLSMCGGVTADPKVAIYDGAGCPAAAAIACNDDFCGLVSQVNFPAVSGQSYTIQCGNFPAAATYSGTFTINALAAGPANDDCTGATPISGYGTFPVSTISATGTVASAGCADAQNDVWFAWTAPITETVRVTTCGLAGGFDTVMAAWPNACPVAPNTEIACNDDGCGGIGESQFTFAATAGTVYLIQAGAFSAAGTWTGSMDISALPPPPTNDDCATPVALAGPGPYAFDNSVATTGAQGQAEALCLFFGSTVIDNDIWMTWTAPTTDLYRLSSCLQTSTDTKVAIYDGAGCPAAAAIACNDDDCGLQTSVFFNTVAGQSYTIQLGTFPGATGGTGTFDINVFVPAVGDFCTTPVNIVGAGPHNYDNTTATTGVEGQNEALCLAFGSTVVDDDLWFCWTAPSSGAFDVTTVGLTGHDSKIAVYDGCGCPAAAALACNDDSCGTLQSTTSFTAVAGQSYTIQVGSFPGGIASAGAFTIGPPAAAPTGCSYDDGVTEDAIGLTAGGRLAWLHRFGAIGDSTTITDISTAYGTLAFPGGGPANGTASELVIWDDSDDDGNPTTGLVHIATIASTVQNVDTDILNSTPVAPAVTVNGVFFVGVALTHTAGQFVAPLDASTNFCGGGDLSWIVGDTTGILDYTNLNAANVPPASLNSIGFGGVWLLRAGCSLEPGSSFCAGDGIDPNVTTLCPCANFGGPGRGCRSSFNVNGAGLTATGVIALDTVTLEVDGVNATGNVIFMRGNVDNVTGLVFGDGVRCVDGTLIRRTKPIFAPNIATFPSPTDTVTLSNGWGPANLTPPGSAITAYYMAYYRNAAAAFCPPETFNGTNAYVITW